MKCFLLFFTLILFQTIRVSGREKSFIRDSTIVSARITVGTCCVNNLNERGGKRGKYGNPNSHFILVSFVNHSDRRIYIPNTLKMLLVDDSLRAVIVKKNKHLYGYFPASHLYSFRRALKPDIFSNYSESPLYVEQALTMPGINTPLSKLQEYRRRMTAQARVWGKLYLKYHKNASENLKLDHCLYLLPHQTRKNVFVVQADSIFKKTGHYKIEYQPMLDSSETKQYPEVIHGFKKFMPKKIASNVLYVDVAKSRAGE